MENTALLIIDVQKGMDDPNWGKRNNPQAEKNIAKILAHWRTNGLPVIHVKHCSVDPGSPLRPELPGNDYKDEVIPVEGEVEFKKTVNSVFIGTNLEKYLLDNQTKSLVVVGLTTDHCVSTSVRMAANLGFEVILVADATATFERVSYDGTSHDADSMHEINLASLHGEFCSVLKTEVLLCMYET